MVTNKLDQVTSETNKLAEPLPHYVIGGLGYDEFAYKMRATVRGFTFGMRKVRWRRPREVASDAL